MAEGRNCCVYLPNDKKLELFLQPKMLGKELMDVVAAHFKLKEKEYFGLFYESRNGQQWWLQDDKRILEHDIVKKSTSRLDLQFAVKYYVDSIKLLQHSITVELFFLQIRSLIYKGRLDIDAEVVFKLAAHVLQITYGDYVNDEITSGHLQKLPVLPSKVLQAHSSEHCENVITELYKELKGNTKGDSILNYLTCVETLPNYGIHYYQIKDKSGVPWWLGLGLKGIFQFDFHDKNTPFKAFYWRQLENLYFREKKFSIEVSGSLQRRSSGGAKSLLSTEPKKKSSEEVKVHAWYGSPALIKTIWIMSIAQHHFYLDQRQNNNKLKRSSSPLSDLSKELDENSNSLLVSKTDTPTMTQKHIRNVDITVKKGSKDETPEVRAAKREMSKALKSRRTELEDRLFDKVQELKKLCLQESEIIGKLPPEYIRYMDLNEVAPKIKKRVGAEFKVKLRNHKNVTSMDRDYPTSVTAASSSSSGISCETIDPADELSQLEQEFEILTQIANAAKKLATDPHAKGRTKNKRWRSFTKTIEKLQAVEEKINVFREKVGQKPSVRASMLIADDEDMIFDDGGISVGGESERSSLSDGLLLDDDTSLSSGGDAISTRSTPAIINGVPQYPASAMISRRNISSSADVDISDIQPKRSLTPPPSFNNFKMDSSSGTLKNNNHHNQYPLLPPSLSSSGVSVDSNKMPTNQNTTRNWIYQKWEVPRNRPNKGWHESSLDSLDTASSMSRQSEENRPTEQYESDSPTKSISNSAENLNIKVTRPLGSPAVAQKVDLKTKKAPMERPASANSNHNNHNEVLSATENDEDVFTLSKLKREVSDSALSELSVKSNPAAVPSTPSDVAKKNLPKIEESPVVETFRKRSSSFTESPSQPLHVPHRGPHKSKNGTLKSAHQPQFVPHPHHDTYNVQQGSISRAPHQGMENPGSINKSRSSQELQPTLYDTNLNIRMHYQNRNAVHHSYAAPTTASWTPPVELTNKSPQMGAMETDSRPDPGAFHPSFHPVYYHPFAPSVPQRFRGVPPNYYPTHHPMYPQRYVDSYSPLIMSSSQRDMLNNEVYQDIGMGWVPSLHEYSSRASVCESASAQSKKEDIKRVLEDHIAMKRTPSNSSSIQSNNNKVQRKIREQYRTLQQQQDNSQSNQSRSSHEKTWADYQKQAPYIAPRPSPQSSNNSSTVSRSQHKSSNDARTNLFHHKPPPPTSTSDAPPLLYKTQLQPRNQPQKSALSSASLQQTQAYYNPPQRIRQHANPTNSASRHDDGELKQRILLQHYLHHNHASVSRDHMNTNSSTHEHEPYQKVVQRFANDQRYYPVSIAPPDGQVFRVPTNRWVSQPNNASVTERIPVKDNGSKSDVWKGGKQVSRAPLQGIPYDVTGGGHFYGIEGYSNPNAVRCRVDQHRSHYEGHHPLHRGQLSASAEDLLWSEGGDNQAGTLV